MAASSLLSPLMHNGMAFMTAAKMYVLRILSNNHAKDAVAMAAKKRIEKKKKIRSPKPVASYTARSAIIKRPYYIYTSCGLLSVFSIEIEHVKKKHNFCAPYFSPSKCLVKRKKNNALERFLKY